MDNKHIIVIIIFLIFSAVTEIEDELTALSERWSHTCQWTTQQLQRLQELQDRWAALDTQHAELLQAADSYETELKHMEANPASEVGAVLERVAALQRLQRSLLEHQRAAAGHMAAAAQLEQDCGPAGLRDRAEGLHDRLDALLMILDVQAQRVSTAVTPHPC